MRDVQDPATIDTLAAAINGSALAALDRVFTEDVATFLRCPASRRSGCRAVAASGRSRPAWTTATAIPTKCVFLFTMRDGLIAREIAYWAKPFPAPEWRAPWVERM